MVLFSEMYLSELIGDPVVDRIQEPIGTVRDILFAVGERFPKITGLLVHLLDGRQDSVILMSEIDMIGRQFVTTQSTKDRIVYTKLRTEELLLWRDLVDKQVVDTQGARVIRINDLKLAKVGQDVRLVAADVGMRGLFRRLGVLGFFDLILGIFKRKIPDTLIGWEHVESLKTGKVVEGVTIPAKHLTDLHPADIAHIISQVHSEEKTAIFSSLTDRTAAEALHELEPRLGALLISTLDTKKALGILEKMPADEAADVFGDIPPDRTEELLRLIRPRKAAEIRKLLKHEDETAGGLMTTEFVSLPQNLNVEQTISRLREQAPGTETIYYLYVIDDENHLTGVLSLRALIVSPPDKPISEVMIKDTISVGPDANQHQVADIISKYNLLAVPVTDSEKKLLGIITVDDVMDFIVPPISRRIRHMLG